MACGRSLLQTRLQHLCTLCAGAADFGRDRNDEDGAGAGIPVRDLRSRRLADNIARQLAPASPAGHPIRRSMGQAPASCPAEPDVLAGSGQSGGGSGGGGGHGSSSDDSGSGKSAEPDAKAAARAAASQTFSDEDLQQSRLTLAFRDADAERRFTLWQAQQLQTVMHPILLPAGLLFCCMSAVFHTCRASCAPGRTLTLVQSPLWPPHSEAVLILLTRQKGSMKP